MLDSGPARIERLNEFLLAIDFGLASNRTLVGSPHEFQIKLTLCCLISGGHLVLSTRIPISYTIYESYSIHTSYTNLKVFESNLSGSRL